MLAMGGICRIWWGDCIKLDDCVCQPVSIGALHFNAVDFGDILPLNEFLQRKLVSPDREERNQCTLLAVSAGLLAASLPSSTAPDRRRVTHTALELRITEWATAFSLVDSLGAAKSVREKNLLSLCHDIVYPNHDRDYRSLSLFLGESLKKAGCALRVFDILYSGSGDTLLQVNVIGSLDTIPAPRLIDLLATECHMRWLQPGSETLPKDLANWATDLADFVILRPFLNPHEVFDSEKGHVDGSPWLTRRQCRRKEKCALTPSSFYQATKLTSCISNAVILENSRTGGYPRPVGKRFDPVNTNFPIKDKDWRNTGHLDPLVSEFWSSARHPYSLEQACLAAELGNRIITKHGALHLGLRSVQEPQMQKQSVLVDNALKYLPVGSALRTDLAELHELGAIPKFRVPPRVRLGFVAYLAILAIRTSRYRRCGIWFLRGRCLCATPMPFRRGLSSFAPPPQQSPKNFLTELFRRTSG